MQRIIPYPKRIEIYPDRCELIFPLNLSIKNNPGISIDALNSVCPDTFCFSDSKQDIYFDYMPEAAFDWKIISEIEKITIQYSKVCHAFYALITIYMMKCQKGFLPCFTAFDKADIENRGYMLDISRGKVPKLSTLKLIADILARFEYNQFQLYIEGFSFFYPSFSEYCDIETSLNCREIKELSEYCKERFIELIPIQNTLGHMAKWLSKNEYSNLAECEDGFDWKGYHFPPTTVDTQNPKTLSLIEKMTEDLLDSFSSEKINFGLDEPFEFCCGKNKDKNPKDLLLDYISRLNGLADKNDRHMMMWADSLFKYECVSDCLNKDITYLEWGYEKEYPFDKRCKKLSEAGADFYVCPGTSSWLSFTGITDDMLKNVSNAVNAAIKYNAKGILLTDWGDENHMQPIWFSMPAIIYCSALCHNMHSQCTDKDIEDALNNFIFKDESGCIGTVLLEAGRYRNFEEIQFPCRTLAHLIYSNKIKTRNSYNKSIELIKLLMEFLSPKEVAQAYPLDCADIKIESIKNVLNHVDYLTALLSKCRIKVENAQAIQDEIECALMFVKLFTMVREKIYYNSLPDDLSKQALEICKKYIKSRNVFSKNGGLYEAILPLKEIFGIAEV